MHTLPLYELTNKACWSFFLQNLLKKRQMRSVLTCRSLEPRRFTLSFSTRPYEKRTNVSQFVPRGKKIILLRFTVFRSDPIKNNTRQSATKTTKNNKHNIDPSDSPLPHWGMMKASTNKLPVSSFLLFLALGFLARIVGVASVSESGRFQGCFTSAAFAPCSDLVFASSCACEYARCS
jgi:hypothetical protein